MALEEKILNNSDHSHVSRRLQQAVDYVRRQWFPVNPKVFEDIQKKIADNVYENTQDLIYDLKSDFALFTYCLRKLKEDGRELYPDPIQSLQRLKLDELKQMLLTQINEISPHEIGSAEKAQSQRIKFTALSSTTSELVARSKNSNTDTAFACALLKQLGLNLVAWNYPSIYGRCLSMVKNSTSTLEELLTENLGFDPARLSDILIFSDNTSPYILQACGSTLAKNSGNFDPSSCAGDGVDQGIVDTCEIGEAFAQLNEPEHYPNISRSFDTVITQLESSLGNNSAQLILKTANEKFSDYTDAIPEVFRVDVSLDKLLSKVSQDYTNQIFKTNVYAQKCPPDIMKLIKEVYNHISKGEVSSAGIGILVNQVIPMVGFTRGCVYLLDSKGSTLFPKLRIGKCKLDRYKPVQLSMIDIDSNLIALALYATSPVRQGGIYLFDDVVSPMIWSLGSKEPLGVLYLEASESFMQRESLECLTIFKAIREAFNECLNF